MEKQRPKTQLGTTALPEHIQLAGILFSLVNGRRRNGTALYSNADRTKFARYGKRQEVKRELDLHKELERLGFPVAQLLSHEEVNDPAYFIEASLGNTCFSELFGVRGSDKAFGKFLLILEHFMQVQSDAKQQQADWNSVYEGSYIKLLTQELPDRAEDIEVAWKKTKEMLGNQPFVITHGDFTTHNILPGGVIDLEDHFYAPAGYDPVSVLVASTWFPDTNEYEMRWPFSFNAQQIEQIATAVQNAGGYNLREVFAPHLFLRASWYTVRMHAYPRLQSWRYKLFNKLLDEYLAGTLTMEKWMGM